MEGFLDDLVKGWSRDAGVRAYMVFHHVVPGSGRHEAVVSKCGTTLDIVQQWDNAQKWGYKWNLYSAPGPDVQPDLGLVESIGGLSLVDQKLYCWFYSRPDPWVARNSTCVRVLVDLVDPDGMSGVVGRMRRYHERACL